MSMFEETKIPLLSKALDAYALRQKVSSSNIANIGTPGYKSKSVEFENLLNQTMQGSSLQMETTNKGHLSSAESLAGKDGISIVQENKNAADNNEMMSGINDVDIDTEMAELAKNQIRFKYASRLLSSTFMGIEKSIKGTL
ncbi:MAG: flagellar basal body rod protein FlgB [Bacteroidetes bacterium]|nr:flagellar basal body rod protein FlgB [Bacteroidota bacterium]